MYIYIYYCILDILFVNHLLFSGGLCRDLDIVNGCCTLSSCTPDGSCFCDDTCHSFGDCCSDIFDIGCLPTPTSTGQYFFRMPDFFNDNFWTRGVVDSF